MRIIQKLIGYMLPKRRISNTNDICSGLSDGYFVRLYLQDISSSKDGRTNIMYVLVDRFGRNYKIKCDKIFTDEFFLRLMYELHENNIRF